MSDTRANIEITASSNRLAAGLRAAMSRVQAFARGAGASMRSITGNSTVGNVAGNLAGRGIDFVADQARAVKDFETKLTRLGIAGDLSADKLDEFRRKARSLSTEIGLGATPILEGAQTYVDLTGDIAGAGNAMAAFGRIAQASGASVSDVSTATAALQQSMKLDASQIEAAFSALIVQGKAGAVGVKDFAGELATLAPQFAQFRGSAGLVGIRAMGATFQMIRRGAGSASEAATQFQALMGELANPQTVKQLKAIGVEVFDASGKMKSWTEIIDALASNKLLNDPRKVAAIFGRKESQAALRSVREYVGEIHRLAEAGKDTGAVQRDLMTYLSSSAGKMDKAWETMKNKIAEAMTPERIEAFANALMKVLDFAAKLVGFIDKVATKVDQIVSAPKRDALDRGRVDAREKQVLALDRNKLNKTAAAQDMLTEAARLQREMEDRGFTGDKKFRTEGQIEELRKLAMKMREQGDVWSPVGDAAKEADKRRVRQDSSGLTPEQQARADQAMLRMTIESALKEGLAGLKAEFKLDNDNLGKANVKSRHARRG